MTGQGGSSGPATRIAGAETSACRDLSRCPSADGPVGPFDEQEGGVVGGWALGVIHDGVAQASECLGGRQAGGGVFADQADEAVLAEWVVAVTARFGDA